MVVLVPADQRQLESLARRDQSDLRTGAFCWAMSCPAGTP